MAPAASARPLICTWWPTCGAKSLLLRSAQVIGALLAFMACDAAADGPLLPVEGVVPAVPLVPAVDEVVDDVPAVEPAVPVVERSVVVEDAEGWPDEPGPAASEAIRARFST